jgi:hypothetical protein
MNKITKTLLIICLAAVMCFTSIPVTAFASENSTQSTITPRWSHLANVNFSFAATSTGGHVNVSYYGYTDSFARADVHIKLQKKFLLVFWTDVDEWSASSTEIDGIFSHTFTLNGTGTYKATLTFTATGTDGTVDTFTEASESKYSH